MIINILYNRLKINQLPNKIEILLLVGRIDFTEILEDLGLARIDGFDLKTEQQRDGGGVESGNQVADHPVGGFTLPRIVVPDVFHDPVQVPVKHGLKGGMSLFVVPDKADHLRQLLQQVLVRFVESLGFQRLFRQLPERGELAFELFNVFRLVTVFLEFRFAEQGPGLRGDASMARKQESA